ncbi:multidrug resistance-associated protein-like protein [Ectocarpus siliculosus]|uniref:Multidrug resistance-associated protein-like protein n=1 Tax=Ectocarpus siliculosus TaxID=2880 RepID=D8LSW3_ECTSI|nr:multidrug resistance-associated protein-like protein [Ectocarpus siliculosus]|eukprot:CBN77890.1 multidrug resistance-associated protein-like protein [Ectocarpus siliculosus]
MIGDSVSHIIQALALGWLIGYFDDEASASWEGWTYASVVVLGGVFICFFIHHFFFVGYTLGMQLRICTTTILYDKILRLRLSSLGQISTGHLVNLTTTDVEAFQIAGTFVNYLWGAPLESLVILYFGLNQVGVSFLAGFAALALMVPAQGAFSRRFSQVRQRVTVLTDERVKLTNQAVAGARLMKINAWEPALEKEIRRVRAEEIRVLLTATLLRAVNEAMFFIQPAVISCLVFATYHLLGNVLAPRQVFTTLALLSITQFTVGKFLYLAVQTSSESWVSIKRIETILLMEAKTAEAGTASAPTPAAGVAVAGEAREGPSMAGSVRGVREPVGGRDSDGGNGAEEWPGLVSLKGASFRWTSGREEDQHAKVFRGLIEGKKKRKDLGISDGADAAPGEGDNGAETNAGGLTLDAIDLRIEPGQLVGVVGPVGSSKSSLLMAMLREITPERTSGGAGTAAVDGGAGHGHGERNCQPLVSVSGSLAYTSQEPWIQSSTIRENILFGRAMDQKRYDAVIRDCALERDLSLLPSGDQTGIGDRGVNLSGGQKARVGLARMAYAHADTYLMDDPLSAVDPAVGRELFSKVVCGRLKESTRVLVTHQVHYLRDPEVDQIIVMHQGKIVGKGSYEELEASGSFAALERPNSPTKATRGEANVDHGSSTVNRNAAGGVSRSTRVRSISSTGSAYRKTPPQATAPAHPSSTSSRSVSSAAPGGRGGAPCEVVAAAPDGSSTSLEPTAMGVEGSDNASVELHRDQQQHQQEKDGGGVGHDGEADCWSESDGDHNEGGLLTEGAKDAPPELVVSEDQESGRLKRSTYWEYIREAAGVWQVVLIFFSMAGGQVLVMGVTVWLARWSRQSEEEQDRSRNVIVLALLTAAAVVVSLFRAVLTFFSLVKASHRLHNRMLKRVVRAPVLFFDSNPVGRILNRFTKDVHFMDDLLPMTLYDCIMCGFMVMGNTLIIFFVNPWVVLSLLPAMWYFVHLMGFYMKTSREAKRLEAVTRSPVYSQLSETLDGLVTIRAFGKQHRFLGQFTEVVNMNTRAYFAWVYTARWLGFRMDMVVIIVLTASCFFSVAVNEYSSSVDAGLLGAAMVYVLQLGGLFQWAVRQAAEVENQMVSAERVLSYCRVPQEAALASEPVYKPADGWPAEGNIEVRDMSMRYRDDLPPVLKGLTLSIKGGSRVGVVGRTGAGKSSLIAALFRLVEYDRERGGIEIDGVDISKVGLHDLRPRMSVVPQTPFLFSGSMRLNLDPFGKQSDAHMWASLEAVQMKTYVQSLAGGLDAPVAEGGGNLSVGQRQLLCLARAVLQRSQILVMDEATANIDQHTDSLIQDVVRTSFKGKTVIMVAHRLNTVIDCDQVVVLSEGSVVEAGHPHVLLRDPPASCGTTAAACETSAAAYATLSSMVDETGVSSAMHLRRLAQGAWNASEGKGGGV